MTGQPTADERTDPTCVEQSAADDLARLVGAIARSTSDSPESILAGLSDDIVAGLFAFLQAHHVDEARRVPRQRGAR
ncbi:hypothetical protein ACFW3D_19835 [Streptomyces sp. NPDC058864]